MTSGRDVRKNLSQARELLEQALDRGAELIAFPENFALMTDDVKQLRAEAQARSGPLVETIQEWAAEFDVWILGGSLPMKTPNGKKITNTSILVSPEGKIRARYDKIHLFDAEVAKDRTYRESLTVKAGKKPVAAKLPIGVAGLSICYDLRFPELYRKYSKAGAIALFVPSAFTSATGRAHWDTLTRARAIENQAYLIAPAQWGTHESGRQTHGHTRIVDPWGRIIAERPAGVGIIWADLNPDHVKKIRADLPALIHRRLP